jgi:hypothetical protein
MADEVLDTAKVERLRERVAELEAQRTAIVVELRRRARAADERLVMLTLIAAADLVEQGVDRTVCSSCLKNEPDPHRGTCDECALSHLF